MNPVSKMQIESSFDCHNTEVVKDNQEINHIHRSVEESLRKITIKEGFKTCKIIKNMLSTDGGNYLGELYEVKITGETKNGMKEINIFVKQIIQGDGLKDLLNVNALYLSEVFVYNELGNIFITLQDKAGVPKNERYRMAENFAESSTDAIILENLTKKGYKTLYRMDVMPLNFAEESIKQLSKFHAMSFVLQHKRTNYFNKKIKTMQSALHFGKPWAEFLENVTDTIFEYFEGTVLNRLKKFRYKMFIMLPKYFKGEISSVKCLCHGDYRINNILVNDNNGEEIKVVVIDYQLICFGSPVFDFLYLIYTGTDRKFRENYVNHLKDLYHDTLTNFLRYFELDVNTIYPRKVYDKDFEENIEFGLMVSLYLMPFCFTAEGEVPDVSKVDATTTKYKFDERFKFYLIFTAKDEIKLYFLNQNQSLYQGFPQNSIKNSRYFSQIVVQDKRRNRPTSESNRKSYPCVLHSFGVCCSLSSVDEILFVYSVNGSAKQNGK